MAVKDKESKEGDGGEEGTTKGQRKERERWGGEELICAMLSRFMYHMEKDENMN